MTMASNFGMSSAQTDMLRELVIRPLAEAGCAVFVFGSRARGDYRPFSDLDLLVEGEVSSSLLASISEKIEESSFPYRVDLVSSSNLADAYRAGVERDRVRILPL